jgi:hypothetical protein
MRVVAEGQVQAGDPVIKTRTGPHELSVADTDALLYLPGDKPDTERLRAASQIPALSPGWQQSFRDLLDGTAGPGGVAVPAAPARPAWAGFRPLRVSRVVRESASVSSFELAAADGTPLPAALAGQYLTLRVSGAGAARTGPQLLTLVRARGRQLPDQRQARAARNCQQLPERPPPAGRGPGRRGPPRRVRAGRRRRPGPADLRGHRGDPGAGHAA